MQFKFLQQKENLKFTGFLFLFSLVGGFSGAYLFKKADNWTNDSNGKAINFIESKYPENLARFTGLSDDANIPSDFSVAAELASPSVVFIKTISNYNRSNDQDAFWDMWDFWGHSRGPTSSAGSGVVISTDGYIVTNNHVVDGADKIEIIFRNKKSYPATVIGRDPNTDLALLKVEANDLKPITMGDSEKTKIGEWVVAIGNPLNLTSTVTAGIVSAKGRNINIVNSQFPIESFIQTDAAINPGNSGGALLNARGELVGVNTAIASKTGSYTGYGFAIPVNIVKKVISDLKDFGEVQIPFIGAEVVDIDNSIADKIKGDDYSGVYVWEVNRGSSAEKSGLKEGDIILKVDKASVDSKAEYMEQLSLHRPGEFITLSIKRNGSLTDIKIQITNKEGTTSILKNESKVSKILGCSVSPISKIEKEKFQVSGGFRLSNIRGGRIGQMGLPEGFIIISVNKTIPGSVGELEKLLTGIRGKIILDGVTLDGQRSHYSFYSY